MAIGEQQFKDRTKAVGLRVMQLVEALPSGRGAKAIGDQLVRCGLPSAPITVRPAEAFLWLISFPSWAMSKKKLMRQCTGLN